MRVSDQIAFCFFAHGLCFECFLLCFLDVVDSLEELIEFMLFGFIVHLTAESGMCTFGLPTDDLFSSVLGWLEDMQTSLRYPIVQTYDSACSGSLIVLYSDPQHIQLETTASLSHVHEFMRIVNFILTCVLFCHFHFEKLLQI